MISLNGAVGLVAGMKIALRVISPKGYFVAL
jgi:hypothetical protein